MSAADEPPRRATDARRGARRRAVRTSATCRCAPAAGSPRRCAAPGSRSTSATSTPPCSRRCAADPPGRGRARCCTAQPGEDGALRDVLELLGHALRRRRGRRPAGSRSTSRSPRPLVGARRRRHARLGVALPHATFRELGAAAVLAALVVAPRAAADGQARPRRLGARRSVVRTAEELPAAMVGGLRLRRHRAASSGSSPAPRSPCPCVDDRRRARARCRPSRSSPTAASTTTPPATPPAPPSSSPRRGSDATVAAACARVALHRARGARAARPVALRPHRRRRRARRGSSRSTSPRA